MGPQARGLGCRKTQVRFLGPHSSSRTSWVSALGTRDLAVARLTGHPSTHSQVSYHGWNSSWLLLPGVAWVWWRRTESGDHWERPRGLLDWGRWCPAGEGSRHGHPEGCSPPSRGSAERKCPGDIEVPIQSLVSCWVPGSRETSRESKPVLWPQAS